MTTHEYRPDKFPEVERVHTAAGPARLVAHHGEPGARLEPL